MRRRLVCNLLILALLLIDVDDAFSRPGRGGRGGGPGGPGRPGGPGPGPGGAPPMNAMPPPPR
jgi:hypothetical protein